MIENVNDIMSEPKHQYRYEKKFVADVLSARQLEFILKSNQVLIREIFEERTVNSIYLDTLGLAHYYHNKDGLMDRKKVRIRWYGDTFANVINPVLEIKSRRDVVGRKEQYAINAFDLSVEVSPNVLRSAVLDCQELPGSIRDLVAVLRPVLLVSYRRKYFQSKDKNFRFTVDQSISYKSLMQNSKNRKMQKSNSVILELKYDLEKDARVAQLMSQLPLRLSKSSKYCDGMDLFL